MDIPEKYRPRLHFSPRTGWLNDPNGLIHVDGAWHAFFQHDPGSTVHGPMHWGHATSADLSIWAEQPVALHPDDLGTCFSGSAIQTAEGEVKLFYTAHRRIEGRDYQTQCLVHVARGFTRFVREPSNPVIANPGLDVFRDPKVLWHAETGRWIMVLTHGQCIGFHTSTDLLHWQLESTFGEAHGRHSDGPWECPDLFPLDAPDGVRHWVLVVGIGNGAYAGGSGTQYFIGAFDGQRFVSRNPPETELWLDHGADFYAAQSFFGASPPTMLAWASNWRYASKTPTHAFRGALSLPRGLRLVETESGLRVAASVPEQVASRFDHFEFEDDLTRAPHTGTYRLTGTVRPRPGRPASIALFGEVTPHFTFERTTEGRTLLHVHRPAADAMPGFALQYQVALGQLAEVPIEVYVDNGLVELSVDHGRIWLTNVHFPQDVAGRVNLTSPEAMSLATAGA